MDIDSSDVEPLSSDSGCISDCSENLTDTKVIDVSDAEIRALSGRTKQCAIYFYYSTTGSSALCAACMISLNDIGRMLAVREHIIELHDAIDGRYCSNCRDPVFLIFPVNMCPICTQ